MEVERIKDTGRSVFYRIWSEYAKDTLAFTPQELLQLLIFLQDFEQQIIADTQENREVEPPPGDDYESIEQHLQELNQAEESEDEHQWQNSSDDGHMRN